ncbi:CPBP family intramembrane glutamic endopeptidase [Azohydromonas caseinilytica]|uniref:CPBP family intramembrane metalloprotease n=1 Tax=Azohydromonas caseinilytica TaxID=2728836 RepID=A0A848F6C5_9BURK|nr:CPBP family intramembrane glutamic endopeptidase [Azohydromonas caseinilytica]NML13830.1 CPBP family intramembrane metalloprotease [Azohydromonas caseinilytica]
MLLTTVLLALAIAAVWLPALRLGRVAVPPSLPLAAAALLAGLQAGVVDARGAVAAVALAALGLASRAVAAPWPRRLLAVAAVLLAFALGLRLVPGFSPMVFLDGVRLSPDAAPMRFAVNADAGLAGLVLALCFCRRVQGLAEAGVVLRRALPVALGTAAVVLMAGWAVGQVRPDLKWPGFAAAWLLKMLLWTCVLEEAFFRGVIQERLAAWGAIASRPALHALPLLVAAGLFGLAHFPGGWGYVALATLAGLGYGWAYARTRRIEAAIAAHFVLNAAHFVGFSYPALLRA